MSMFGNLMGRKIQPAEAAPAATTSAANVIELDQELFFPIATKLGEDNETVRNLLIDAEHKLSELDVIRRSIGKLVDPVSKTLRAYEETKNQKIGLQTQLNNTRAAYAKQLEALDAAEQRIDTLETERTQLRELMAIAQQRVAGLEGATAEQTQELNARRGQIVDLQRLIQQITCDLQAARDDNLRLTERVAGLDKRLVQLEAEAHAAQQQLQLAEHEKAALSGSLDKALAETVDLTRKLSDNDKTLTSTQRRLSQLETAFGEIQSERTKLVAALAETTEKYHSDMLAQNARFEALTARATLAEQMLGESRRTLTSRADEIAAYDRRVAEAVTARGALEARLAEFERGLTDRDNRIKELEEARAALTGQSEALTKSLEARDLACRSLQHRLQAQDELVKLLEHQLGATRQTTEVRIEELNAELQRERLERTMAEGALEAGRRDIARLLRELAASQYRPPAVANDAATAQPAKVQSAA